MSDHPPQVTPGLASSHNNTRNQTNDFREGRVPLRAIPPTGRQPDELVGFASELRALGAPAFIFDSVASPCGYATLAEALEVASVASSAIRWLSDLPSPTSSLELDLAKPQTDARALALDAMKRWRLSDRGVLARLVAPEDTDLSEMTQLVVYKSLLRAVRRNFKTWPSSRVAHEDVAHQVFLDKFFTKWSTRYDPTRSSLDTYLAHQVRPRALRKQARLAVGIESDSPEVDVAATSFEDSIVNTLTTTEDLELVDLVVSLHFQGYSYKEIQGMTGVTAGAARVRVHRYVSAERKRRGVSAGANHRSSARSQRRV